MIRAAKLSCWQKCKRYFNKPYWLVLVTSFLIGTFAQASPIPIVRVMVEREKHSVRLQGFDLIVSDASTQRRIASQTKRSVLDIKCSLGAAIELRTGPTQLTHSTGPIRVTSMGGFIRVGENQYRDDLYIYSFNGDCVVVNHVDLEKYLAGVLNSEMNASWNQGALQAQAIAARTYAIYQMQEASTARFKGSRPPFDLQGNVNDQVYEGAHKEKYRALKAVQDTRGQILTFAGKPIKAFYHSTCGGRTETPERVWGLKFPYFKAVDCGFCNRSPRYNWRHTVAAAQIEKRLRDMKLLWGKLISIRVVTRNKLGRADRVEVRSSQGSQLVPATKIRDALGTTNVMSTDFNVVQQGGEFVFVGHGSGHGVGMCQWGAKEMGDKGYSAAQILKRYYPIAALTKAY